LNSDSRLAAACCGVDLRALAAFRVGLGACVLADVLQRATSLRAHYTDAGVLSRADVLQHFAWLHEWAPSLHLAGGSSEFQAVLFLVHAAAAIALIVGYRPTASALLAWLLTSSVQLRNLYIGGGFDALLRMLLLWSVFLPLAARWSVQSLRIADGGDVRAQPYLSIASVALLVQIVIVYFAAGMAKAEVDVWRDGSALQFVLNDEMFATAVGALLAGWPEVCRWLSWAVLAIELTAPALLVLSGPWPSLRTLVIAVFVAMNIGFGLSVAVGPFPWIASVALVAFLPGPFWDRVELWMARSPWFKRAASVLETGTRWLPVGGTRDGSRGLWPQRMAAGLCALLLAYVVVWNYAVARDPMVRAPAAVRWFGEGLFLQQSWRMFARPSTLSSWIVIPGTLVDGSEVDLLAAGGPVPGDEAIRPVSWARPESIVGQAADIRWRLLLRRVVGGGDDQQSPSQYGRYLCVEWNRARTAGRQLARFEFVRIGKTLAPPFTAQEYERKTVWWHDCFG